MDLSTTLPMLLGLAWLLPLASFALIVFVGPRLGRHGIGAAWVATGAIMTSCLLSLVALGSWLWNYPLVDLHHSSHAPVHSVDHAPERPFSTAPGGDREHAGDAAVATAHDAPREEHPQSHAVAPNHYAANWYTLGSFGSLTLSIGYYIDALTVTMFAMVTLIATLIHFYAYGYMHDELHEVTDHEVTLTDGRDLHRPGRFHRFFQYLSLFCFSMLGIVIAGNMLMIFIFWELVGICSYFLIGFYIERRSASNAANKAFIVNRVGDFGMIIGLMALWGGLGTFSFGDYRDAQGQLQPGIFSLVRAPENDYAIRVPDGMVRFSAREEVGQIVRSSASPADAEQQIQAALPEWRDANYGYWLLVIAGLGIFCGCIGKSAQFPLHVWLPDAMEGPTPVSALVHSATMVAAGVYLVGRFYPAFTPEVLLVIAYVGAITLFIAATIAIVATDIKRVLAYSTISQLGYMMLGLGVGGWQAGIFHLITHAFFKSLLFMCSGSVIHATHTNDMRRMGGLRHKMPWTAYTMLVGCLAIAGAGLPFAVGPYTLGLSGYYSKDAIVSQALMFSNFNSLHSVLFYAPVVGAAITAFYMFRLWYLTFAGEPRDHRVYDYAHESPKVMYIPLVVLAVFAVAVAWRVPGSAWELTALLEQARPAGGPGPAVLLSGMSIPFEPELHAEQNAWIHHTATFIASLMAIGGFGLATMMYGLRKVDPDEVRRQFAAVHRFLVNKWWFDELYEKLFIRPTLLMSRWVSAVDGRFIDRIVNGSATVVKGIARIDDLLDRLVVDGLVNWTAERTYRAGTSLRNLQTGQLRQYVMFIGVGTVALFVIVTFFWSYAIAGN